MSDRFILPYYVDTTFPYSGPCAFCGGPEARHRILDTIVERHRAGESVAEIAWDYDAFGLVIEAICAHWDDEAQGWVA